jgi:pSer/pThr/pTyr-binding forkhead associated (FHA) protein
MPNLIVQDATHRAAYELAGDVVMIGRAPLNDIVIDNPLVSAQHAMLQKIGDSYWLKDLNSTNGTHLNGILFTYGELKDGDTIRFASVMAIFSERRWKRWSTCAIRTFWTSSTLRRKSGARDKGDTREMELNDPGKKQGRVDHVSLQHQIMHNVASKEAKEASSARKAIGERLLAYLDEEIDTSGRNTSRFALNFWRNRIRNLKYH